MTSRIRTTREKPVSILASPAGPPRRLTIHRMASDTASYSAAAASVRQKNVAVALISVPCSVDTRGAHW